MEAIIISLGLGLPWFLEVISIIIPSLLSTSVSHSWNFLIPYCLAIQSVVLVGTIIPSRARGISLEHLPGSAMVAPLLMNMEVKLNRTCFET